MSRVEQELSIALTRELGFEVRLRIADAQAAEADLTEAEQQIVDRFKTPHRRLIWLRGRSALKQLLLDAGQSPDSGQISFPNARYSISHCKDVSIALAIDANPGGGANMICGAGVDIEPVREMDPDGGRFFLTQHESASPVEDFLRLWTLKEALFKCDPDNQGRLLLNYEIAEPRLWSGRARVCSEEAFRIRYSTVAWQDCLISAAVMEPA